MMHGMAVPAGEPSGSSCNWLQAERDPGSRKHGAATREEGWTQDHCCFVPPFHMVRGCMCNDLQR